MKRKLGGWQRLWIIFCVFYFIGLAIFTISHIPSGYEYERKRLFDSINLVIKFNAKVGALEKAGFSKTEIEDYLKKGGKLRFVKGGTILPPGFVKRGIILPPPLLKGDRGGFSRGKASR